MKKSIKGIALAILVTGAVCSSTFISLAGWEQSETGWKYKDDNTQQYVAARWVESTSEAGLWYYIGTDGVMVTNTLIDNQYYVNEAGEWREGQTTVANVVDDNSPWTAEELEENPLRADYTRAEYNEIERKMNEMGQTIGGDKGFWDKAHIELGDKPIQSDPEFDQKFNEGLIRN